MGANRETFPLPLRPRLIYETLIVLALLASLQAAPAQAAALDAPVALSEAPGEAFPLAPDQESIPALIAHYAAEYGISHKQLYDTLWCESRFNPRAIGDNGQSFGIAQIHRPSHPSITKEQAFNPDWAIRWTSEQFKAGRASMWTCYRNLYGK